MLSHRSEPSSSPTTTNYYRKLTLTLPLLGLLLGVGLGLGLGLGLYTSPRPTRKCHWGNFYRYT